MHSTDPVNRIMSTPVLTIGPNESVREMLRLLQAYPVHHLPVVAEGRLVGLVSSADVMKFQHFLPESGDTRIKGLEWEVHRVMQSPVITVSEHESAYRAAELMVTHGIHCVPVVNADDHLIGIVTTTDIMEGCLLGNHGTDSVPHSPRRRADEAHSMTAVPRAADTTHDQHGTAAACVQLQSRIHVLEQVLHEARRYLSAGQDERLHAALRLAIDRADRDDAVRLPERLAI